MLSLEFGVSNFAMGAILGTGFPQAQVHTVHSMSAEGWVKIFDVFPSFQEISCYA